MYMYEQIFTISLENFHKFSKKIRNNSTNWFSFVGHPWKIVLLMYSKQIIDIQDDFEESIKESE